MADPLLNPGQRRAITTVLGSLEQCLNEVDEILESPSIGVLFHRERPQLKGDQRAQVVATMGELRASIGLAAETLTLPREEQDPFRRIAGLLGVSWQSLGEIDAHHLVRYGNAGPGLEEVVNPLVDRLMTLVSRLRLELDSAAGPASHGLSAPERSDPQ